MSHPLPSTTRHELLRQYYRAQLGLFVSRCEESEHALSIESDLSDCPRWNHVAWINGSGPEFSRLLQEHRTRATSRRRHPVIFIPQEGSDRLDSELRAGGYERFHQETWLAHSPGRRHPAPSHPNLRVREVGAAESAEFSHLLAAADRLRDPLLRGAVEQAYDHHQPRPAWRHFLAYENHQPAGMASLAPTGHGHCIFHLRSVTENNSAVRAGLLSHILDSCPPGEPVFLQLDDNDLSPAFYETLGFARDFGRLGYRSPRGIEPALDDAFWRDRLRGIPAATTLGSPASSTQAGHGRERCDCSRLLREGLATLASEHGLEPGVALLAAWAYLLGCHSTQEQVFFGARLAVCAGDYRLWPVAPFIPASGTILEWLRQLDSDQAALATHAPVAPSDLAALANLAPDQAVPESLVHWHSFPAAGRALFPIEVSFTDPAGSAVEIRYHHSHLSDSHAQRLAGQLLHLLEQFAARPTLSLSDVSIMPPGERGRVLHEWNDTSRPYRPLPRVHQLVDEQGLQTPGAVAIEGYSVRLQRETSLTHAALNAEANRLAHHLRRLGAGPNVVVGICLERSVEMAVATLAILKSGAAYVPLDPAYPAERLAYMLEDTRAPIILTQASLLARLPADTTQLLPLDADPQPWMGEPDGNPPVEGSTNDLAYLIYTSGSTGKPKGVAMRHEPLVNLLQWQLENWSGPRAARTVQFASLNFDVSFQEIFSTWASGGTLLLVTEETRRDSAEFLRFLRRTRAQRLFLPFVALKHLAEAATRSGDLPSDLVEIITAGEQLQITPAVEQFFARLPHAVLHNQYGPSESHVVTAARLDGPPAQWPRLPSIGKPIANTRIYLLDSHRRPVPIGVPGELLICGLCLAQGYLNRPDLTAERFVPDLFSTDNAARCYKTGDLARWLPSGDLEFLGRIDHQVKIRGFRIELGELETILVSHPAVREAVVVARPTPAGDKKLAAYVVGSAPVTAAELRAFLREKVPAYAVPSDFLVLEHLPLTPNGKVDRRALPDPAEAAATETPAPLVVTDPLQPQLKLIYERVLERKNIDFDTSFFELGGDSLQALKLIVEIESATGKKLPLSVLYRHSTILELATKLREQPGADTWSSLVTLQPAGPRPPLFLVHTTPGDILGYGNLVYHLGAQQPCYGFQSLGLHDLHQAHRDLGTMAAYYVKLLRGLQPHGPYRLCGWCYGGIVAVEMARQLLDAGQSVPFLGLIETPAPAPGWKNFRYHAHRLACLLRMPPGAWIDYLRLKIRYYRGVRGEDERRYRRAQESAGKDPQHLEERNRLLAQLEAVYRANMKALDRYQPRPYPGAITLYNAADLDPSVISDPQRGWVGLARDIRVETIPGAHDTILMEPHVAVLAEKLSRALRGDAPRSNPENNSP